MEITKAVTAEEMRRIDRETIEVMGIPAGVLMAEAGKAVADFALTLYRGDGAVAVACGTGNNGGDGFVAAARLAECGVPVRVFLAGESSRVSPVAEVYLGACLNAGVIVTTVTGPDAMRFDLKGCSLVIDALRGLASGDRSGSRRGDYRGGPGIPVVSVDVPSGLLTARGRRRRPRRAYRYDRPAETLPGHLARPRIR